MNDKKKIVDFILHWNVNTIKKLFYKFLFLKTWELKTKSTKHYIV